ncbi:NADH dehydrogenase [ubiquinone] iron-sulfur protein 5 [Ambystoma mexicanum]|uniref:NADH dehydrogenase [ubiquinone] iron-sulfur protein 5 n=1 Tax=Ambystoma mexicanum TaxID=8296 RepID=UPI0037E7DA74
MPFFDLQGRLGIDLDKWLLLQSGTQPWKRAALCHVFEKEWVECAHGIGKTRAKKECALELEDFKECMSRAKTIQRIEEIRKQKKKLEKEGQYTAPYNQKEEPSS